MPENEPSELVSRDSFPDFAALQAKAKKRNLLLAGAVLLLGLAGGAVGLILGEAHAAEEAKAAAADLRGCLLQGPLEKGETNWERFRRLQLRSMSLSDKERLEKGPKVWPRSCHDTAVAARSALEVDLSPEETEAFSALIKRLGNPRALTEDLSSLASPVLASVDAHQPGDTPSTEDKLPRRPLNVDDMAEFPALSQHGTALSKTYTEDNPGLALPVLVVEEKRAPLLCEFYVDRKAECARLEQLNDVKHRGLRLLGTAHPEAGTLVFAGRRGSEGVFLVGTNSDTAAPVDKLYSYGGHAAKDGHVSILGWDTDDKSIVLVDKPPKKESERIELNPNFRVGNYFYSSQLLWDHVLVRGITPDNERRLFSMPLNNANERSFQLVDIGEVPEPGLIRYSEEAKTHLTGCRTRKGMVVRVRGYDNDFLTFHDGKSFSMLVEAPTWGTLGCHGGTATLVGAGYADNGTKLHHATCTSAGCEVKELSAESLDRNTVELRPNHESHIQAVDLKGKLLAVWLAGEDGGLRMRLAEPDLFARTQDVVVLDDWTENGKKAFASSVLGFRLFSRGDFAVLLLSSMAGVHALRISADGSFKPIEVSGGD